MLSITSSMLAGALALMATAAQDGTARTPVRATQQPQRTTPIRATPPIDEDWGEDPEKSQRIWRSMVGGEDYAAALAATGMAQYLAAASSGGAAPEGATSWTSTGPRGAFGSYSANGRVAAVQLVRIGTTDYVYAGASSGGLWRSTVASGGVWEDLGHGLPNPAVRAFAVHPTNPQRILVGSGDYQRYKGGGMFLTTNGGASWSTIAMASTPVHFQRMAHALDDPTVVVAASDSGLWRSTNSGDAWTQLEPGNWQDLVLHPTNASIMYAVRAGYGVYKSTNKGGSWTQLTSPNLPPALAWGRAALALCRDFPDTVALAAEASGKVLGVYRTTNGGTTWTNVTSNLGSGSFGNGQAFHVLSLAFRPDDRDELFLGVDTVARSFWNSSTSQLEWKVGETAAGLTIGHFDVTQFQFSALTGDDVLWITNDGGIYRHSFTGGSTVSFNGNATTGLALSQIDFHDADRSMQMIGLQDNGVLRTIDSGAVWTFLGGGDGGPVQITDAEHFDAWLWWGVGWVPFRAIYGLSIETLPNPGASANFHYEPMSGKVWTAGGSSLWSTGVHASPVTWTLEKSGGLHSDPTAILRHLWGSEIEPSTLYVDFGWDYEGDLTVLHKQGSTWVVNGPTTLGLGATGHINAVTPSSEWPSECWVGCRADIGDAKLYHSTDYGQTWTDLTGTLSAARSVFDVRPQPFAPHILYAGTELGVFRSTDSGASWQPFQDGLPIVAVTNLQFVVDDAHTSTHKLRITTYGRGTWERDVVAPPVVYVDKTYAGTEDGSYEHPFNTVAEGVAAAPAGAIVAIRSNTYDEPQVVTKNVRLMTYLDPSVIR